MLWKLILLSYISEKLAAILDLDGSNIWTQCLHDLAKIFKKTMLIAIENLSITQYYDTLEYPCIYNEAYQLQL